MDISSIRRDIEYVKVSGQTLSSEEQTILQSCMPILASNYHIKDLQLWGKIVGTANDYIVAVGYKDNLVDNKVFLATSDVMGGTGTWFQLDTLDPSTKAQYAGIRGRFVGIATKEYVVTPASAEADEVSVNESTRLAYVVSCIDADTHVVPRGVLMQQPQGDVYVNKTFEGLKAEDSTQKEAYVHRRKPQLRTPTVLAADKTADPSVDFLDRLSDDPSQHWVLRSNGVLVTLANLYWPGAIAYHKPQSSIYGFGYFGTGEATTDLGFAL